MRHISTIKLQQIAKLCGRVTKICTGDSGEAKCLFCNKCVLGLEEKKELLEQMQVYNP